MEITITYVLNDDYTMKEIIFEHNDTGLTESIDLLESIANVTKVVTENHRAMEKVDDLFNELNLKTTNNDLE